MLAVRSDASIVINAATSSGLVNRPVVELDAYLCDVGVVEARELLARLIDREPRIAVFVFPDDGVQQGMGSKVKGLSVSCSGKSLAPMSFRNTAIGWPSYDDRVNSAPLDQATQRLAR
jgi:hypothetical protein